MNQLPSKAFGPQHVALLKEARERLCAITGGIGAISPLAEEYLEIETIIEDIEWLLGIRS